MQVLVKKKEVTPNKMLSALFMYKLILISAEIDYFEN
jgi:hypothetical protein